MKYYKMYSDMHSDQGWFLGNISTGDEWDFWQYIETNRIESYPKDIGVKLLKQGHPLDISFAAFNIFFKNEDIKSCECDICCFARL